VLVIANRLIKISKIVILVAILTVVLVVSAGRERVLTAVLGPIEIKAIDFKQLVPGSKPNQFLVCPVGYCLAKPQLISPVFAISSTLLRQRWRRLMQAQPGIQPGAADEASMQYDFIQRSALMRFPDSITVQFISLSANSSTLAIYSRSQYGYSDFGVNEARILAWLAALERK
jgi:uncharacterized protein (DUF1499 family)